MTGPITPASPVEHRATLPGQADLVVIGGGIIGVMTAWEAAKAGHRVVLTLGPRYALHDQTARLCADHGAVMRNNYEGTNLDALRQSGHAAAEQRQEDGDGSHSRSSASNAASHD